MNISQPNALGLFFQTSNGLGALGNLSGLATTPFAPALAYRWWYVTSRFQAFLAGLDITPLQKDDGETKQAGIRDCLNRYYWNIPSGTENSFLIGSWGKDTRVRPSRDIDVLFLLPPTVWQRFQERGGNRQSQLLQEVKEVLAQSYRQTTMRGDGQVVLVPFNTIPIEVAIGFRCANGNIIVCDTNNGGRYTLSTAEAEAKDLAVADLLCNRNASPLVRMMKQWQRECNVPLKSFQIERLAVEFLYGWNYRLESVFYYDWMVRDFLAYLVSRAHGHLTMPGSAEVVLLGDAWLSRAQTAYQNAVSACDHERDNYGTLAGYDWQKVFGTAIPAYI